MTRDRESNLKLTGLLIHVAGLASLAGGALLYQAVVSALIVREQEQIVSEAAEKEQFLARADDVRGEHKSLTDRLGSLETNAVTMRQRIPELPREAEFLKHVSQAADDEGLKIHRYERGSLDRKPTHAEFTVQLSCEGTYTSIVGFLDRLAKLPRVATVQRMTLSAGTVETYPFDLTLLLYYGAQATGPSS